MTRRIHLLATALVAATLCLGLSPAVAKEPFALPDARSPEAVGFDSARLEKLDAAMAKVVADGRVPGMSTMLVRHGKVVEFKTYGAMAFDGPAMAEDSIFRIYSMSKPITGIAMMILFEEGKWRLDDPVTRYIPEFKNLKVWKGIDAEGKPILVPVSRPPTMREVMSHTAGFGYGLADKHPVDLMFRDKRILASNGLQDMINKVADTPLIYEPGTQWSYSVAVDIQGYLVEKLSGQTLGQFMQQRIFDPLKMTDTGFIVPADKVSRLAKVYGFDPRIGKVVEAVGGPAASNVQDFTKPPAMESGGGGLVSTTTDYARFAQMVANGGELEGVRIVSPATIELMGTNHLPEAALVNSNGSAGTRFNKSTGFGLDFMVVDDPRKAGTLEGKGTMSWGGAAGTWFWVDPTNDVVFVGMIQRFGGSGGDDLGSLTRTLTYQALVNPKK